MVAQAIAEQNLSELAEILTSLSRSELLELGDRLDAHDRAVMFRLLPKDQALELFESLPVPIQSDLVRDLRDTDVVAVFAELDPDDRVWLLDELPASIATRLLRGLPEVDRQVTTGLLGYPADSIGRRMSPDYVSTHVGDTAGTALERVRNGIDEAETIYSVSVLDDQRRVVGIVSLRSLLRAEASTPVADLLSEATTVFTSTTAEDAARLCTRQGYLVLPVVDSENRLVGILTIDDAARILEREESEDAARQGGVEPLRRPYLSTPVLNLVRSRVVWLLVLAVGATLTVQVLEIFEATLAEVTVLALFVPLLIGTGGNTGNQAATTVTRALALGEVEPRHLARVIGRELRVGAVLGAVLGAIGASVTALVYDPKIGLVIGLTLLAICLIAATIGGMMPLVARSMGVDPAVFSNPFITTFVDATGLIIYFLIAQAILQL